MASQMPLIACHECDLLQREVPLPPGRVLRCRRCGAELYRSAHRSIDHTFAFTVTALILFVLANVNPIIGLEIQGTLNDTTLVNAVYALWNQEMRLVGTLVLVTTFLAPTIQLAIMSHLLLALKRGRIPAGFTLIMRVLQGVNPWGMVEVFILGVIVALVKLTHYGTLIPGLALWSFGLLTVFLAAIAASFDSRDAWERAYPLASPGADR
jgi:paraquat-inducible protein A